MENRIYIEGNLIIDVESTLFKCRHLSAGEKIPEGEPTRKGDLIITDSSNSSSFFNSYYVAGNIASKKVGVMIGYFTIDTAFQSACKDLDDLSSLIKTNNFKENLLSIFYRHIYMGAISILEVFLSNTLFSWVFSSEKRFNDYLSLQTTKISLKDIRDAANNIEDTVLNNINNSLYHRLSEVKNTYQKNIGLTFPSIDKLEQYIKKRHDLVHRNGKTEKHLPIDIELSELESLLNEEKKFIESVYNRLKKKE